MVRTQATTGGGGSSEGRCRGVGCGTGLASSHGGVPNQLSDGRGSPPRVDGRQGPGLGRRQDALGPVSWLEARASLQSREGRGRAVSSVAPAFCREARDGHSCGPFMGVATARGGAEPPNCAQSVPRPESAGEPGREGLPGRQWELEAKRTGFTQGWSGRWRLPSREATCGEVPSSLAAGRALWLLLALSHRTTAPSFTFSGTPPQSRDAGMQDVTLRESVLNE